MGCTEAPESSFRAGDVPASAEWAGAEPAGAEPAVAAPTAEVPTRSRGASPAAPPTAAGRAPRIEALPEVRRLLALVDEARLRRDLFALSKDPLPVRTLNRTLPGHARCTLHEADDFLQARLEGYGYAVEREGCRVQAFRNVGGTFARPAPEDPWYDAFNLYAKHRGRQRPGEVIVLIAHKDSQSWIDSPGAYDNAVGTVAMLELARLLRSQRCRRTIWCVFCNEEHTPWTSVTVAEGARARGERLVAVFNLDSLGGKPAAAAAAGLPTNVTAYTADEGEALADLMAAVNAAYGIGLQQSKARRAKPEDDDGSFVRAGFPAAVINVGSWPYADPNYHGLGDTPERVDVANVRQVAQATLAAVLHLDRGSAGQPGWCPPPSRRSRALHRALHRAPHRGRAGRSPPGPAAARAAGRRRLRPHLPDPGRLTLAPPRSRRPGRRPPRGGG